MLSPKDNIKGGIRLHVMLNQVSKTFSKENNTPLNVFNDIQLSIQEGEFIALLGPSGCGKSTLLSMIAGLDQPSSGTVLIDKKQVQGPGNDKSMVFQEPALFPWLTVINNIMFPLRKKLNKKERLHLAHHYLQMVHLSKFSDHYPHELSGGMQQRVAIARALAMDTKLLLMDEPFGALDEQTRLILQDELEDIWLRTRKTIIFVTHSIREAIRLSDRIILMGARPRSIIADFKIDLPRPRLQKEMAEIEEEILSLLKIEINQVMKEELEHVNNH